MNTNQNTTDNASHRFIAVRDRMRKSFDESPDKKDVSAVRGHSRHSKPLKESPEIIGNRIDRFIAVRNRMRHALIDNASDQIQASEQELEPLLRWATSVDLLADIGVTNVEAQYVNMVEWLISSDTWGEVRSLEIQKKWLLLLGVTEANSVTTTAQTLIEKSLGKGRIDLVLHYPGRLIVGVEAKTKSREHNSGGEAQTIHYAKWLYETVGEAESTPRVIVFLTLDRSEAQNPSAKLATYADLAALISQIVDVDDLPKDLQSAVSMALTHFVDSSPDIRLPLSEIVRLRKRLMAEELVSLNDTIAALEASGQISQLIQETSFTNE